MREDSLRVDIYDIGFRPLSWGLSFNEHLKERIGIRRLIVFVPFLGDFLSIQKQSAFIRENVKIVFVPFLGDFLSITITHLDTLNRQKRVFVPFLGDFLSIIPWKCGIYRKRAYVFVPFLGDFLSIRYDYAGIDEAGAARFRPLSWGLSFNSMISPLIVLWMFSSPFLGTFFQ